MSMHPSRQAYVEEAEGDDDAMEGISLADVRKYTSPRHVPASQ